MQGKLAILLCYLPLQAVMVAAKPVQQALQLPCLILKQQNIGSAGTQLTQSAAASSSCSQGAIAPRQAVKLAALVCNVLMQVVVVAAGPIRQTLQLPCLILGQQDTVIAVEANALDNDRVLSNSQFESQSLAKHSVYTSRPSACKTCV